MPKKRKPLTQKQKAATAPAASQAAANGKSDTAKVDTAKIEATKAEAGKPDGGNADQGKAQTAKTNTAKAEPSKAKSANGGGKNGGNKGAASKAGSPNGGARGSSVEQARQLFAQAARLYERLAKERSEVLSRLQEVDAVLAQLPSSLRGGQAGQPASSASEPKRRGRPPKSSAANGTRGVSGGGRTVRQIVETELGKGRALSWAELEKLVKSERPDVKSGSISSMIQVLREKGVVKVTGEPRQYQYSLASN